MASKPNMPVGTASVSWTDSNGLNIRVYSTDGYTVSERAWSDSAGSWSNGSFSQQGETVSATCSPTPSGVYLRVYCTFEDSTTEWCFDPGGNSWYQGGYTPT
jgi:hypothetical protein